MIESLDRNHSHLQFSTHDCKLPEPALPLSSAQDIRKKTCSAYRVYECVAAPQEHRAAVKMNMSSSCSNMLEVFSEGWHQPASPSGVPAKARWLRASRIQACRAQPGCSQSDDGTPSQIQTPTRPNQLLASLSCFHTRCALRFVQYVVCKKYFNYITTGWCTFIYAAATHCNQMNIPPVLD